MIDLTHGAGPDPLTPARSGLLVPALRRDLADLNAQYLDLGLTTGCDADPRFGWSDPVRRCLLEVDADIRARIAAVPFALFSLTLPADPPAVPPPRVEDSRAVNVQTGWQGRCESLANQAVFLARRLAESQPLALRVVFGLPEEVHQWLAECRLAQLTQIATNPRLIRPRWRLHLRFWETVTAAARRGTPTALQWSHCIGLCLIDAAARDEAPPPPRRPRR
ncbi:MAG: hypothetical protein NDI84_05155 [Steroidobacteraceae bacterium]|nr:hypothetical protein [Steroidobacteraceae bacterium]